jgi:hypothetical protein
MNPIRKDYFDAFQTEEYVKTVVYQMRISHVVFVSGTDVNQSINLAKAIHGEVR